MMNWMASSARIWTTLDIDLGDDDEAFWKKELERAESLDKLLAELDDDDDYLEALNAAERRDGNIVSGGGIGFGNSSNEGEGRDDGDGGEGFIGGEGVEMLWVAESLNELLGAIGEDDDEIEGGISEEEDRAEDEEKAQDKATYLGVRGFVDRKMRMGDPFAGLENALLQGVVPASARVGTDSMAGDFGFDPLEPSMKTTFAPRRISSSVSSPNTKAKATKIARGLLALKDVLALGVPSSMRNAQQDGWKGAYFPSEIPGFMPNFATSGLDRHCSFFDPDVVFQISHCDKQEKFTLHGYQRGWISLFCWDFLRFANLKEIYVDETLS